MGKVRSIGKGSAPRGSKRARLPRDERREHLLESASAILLREGPDGLTMDTLAREAGVSRALGYAYFENVDTILVELVDREVSDLLRRVQDAIGGTATFEERVRAAIRTYFDVAQGPRGNLIGILRLALRQEGFEKQRYETTLPFENFIAGIIFEEYDVPPRISQAMADITVGVANSAVLTWIRLGIDREPVEEACVRFMLSGLEGAFERRR